MYRLNVIHRGQAQPTETVDFERAADVLAAIPTLLGRHTECERIEVMLGQTRLFAVDCKGARLAD
jgi:hypothetical protein